MIVGVMLAVGLAVLSFVRVSPSGISYRSPETWSNQATLILTQQGAPELRSVLPSRPGGLSPSLADTGRFAGLIDVYAALATSDAVVGELRRRGLLKPEDLKDGALPIAAAALTSAVNPATPMMTITGTSSTGPKATALTIGATKAFLDVLNRRQLAAKIPERNRIEAHVLRSSETPKLVGPRSKAVPVLVLLGGLIATLALAFTRDNVARRAGVSGLTTAALRRPATRCRRSIDRRPYDRSGPSPGPSRWRREWSPTRRSVSLDAARPWGRFLRPIRPPRPTAPTALRNRRRSDAKRELRRRPQT